MIQPFRGSAAQRYDAKREDTPGRHAERRALELLVEGGPVLDCPVGTGAFLDVYGRFGVAGVDASDEMLALARARVRSLEDTDQLPIHGPVFLERGDLLAGLRFSDDSFSTAVCVRFCWWLEEDELYRAVGELRRVTSDAIVLSIRLGSAYGRPPREVGRRRRKRLTHTRAQLERALGDWRVELEVRLVGAYRMVRAVPS